MIIQLVGSSKTLGDTAIRIAAAIPVWPVESGNIILRDWNNPVCKIPTRVDIEIATITPASDLNFYDASRPFLTKQKAIDLRNDIMYCEFDHSRKGYTGFLVTANFIHIPND